MKNVVVNFINAKISEDTQWARQFAGLDPDLVKEYPYQDWPVRAHRPINEKANWARLVQGISVGAQAAGEGGTVQLLSGHGGSACVKPHTDIVDPRCRFPNEGACTFDFDSLVRFTQVTVFYRTRVAGTESRDEKDEPILWSGKNRQQITVPLNELDWETNAAGRRKIRGFYDDIGKILRSNKVKRFVFLSCNLGHSPGLVDQIAKDWGVEIGVFKFLTTVVPGNNFKDGKARYTLGRDKSSPGTGTNVDMARFDTPSLLDTNLTYVGHP